MKLKEFFELVPEKWGEQPTGPVLLLMTPAEFEELLVDAYAHGWCPSDHQRPVRAGREYWFGWARVRTVRADDLTRKAADAFEDGGAILSGTVERGRKAKGGVVVIVGETIGTVDETFAAKIAEQLKTRSCEPVSAGYDPEPEQGSIWTEIRDRIEDAVEREQPTEVMRWLEVAERLHNSPRALGFDRDEWAVAPED